VIAERLALSAATSLAAEDAELVHFHADGACDGRCREGRNQGIVHRMDRSGGKVVQNG
jgi:hypothetical protein